MIAHGRNRVSNPKPFQSAWKLARGEINLEDPSVIWRRCSLRRVKDWGGVEPHVSCVGQAGSRAAPANDLVDFANRHAAHGVRSWSNQERRIGDWNVVKVSAQCDHAGEHLEWWSNVVHSALHGPGTEPFNIDPFLDANRPILVPGQGPIAARGLVEQDGPDGTAACSECGGGDGTERTTGREQRIKFKVSFDAQAGLISRQRFKRRTKFDEEQRQRSLKSLRSVFEKAKRDGIE